MRTGHIVFSRPKRGSVAINIMLAVLVSLVVNFSNFVFMLMQRNNGARHPLPEDSGLFVTLECIFYAVFAFVLLTVFTYSRTGSGLESQSYRFLNRFLIALALSVAFYFLAPYMRRDGDISIMMLARRLFNPMLLLKCSFTIVVVALYSKIYELVAVSQRMTLENEKLKTENIRSRYDVLMNQMNPHFFFNSLNSLSMLVREERNDDALVYIDRLSDTFRYIIRSGNAGMTTLREEMEFLASYRYLLELRYAGKLYIDIRIPEECMDLRLPSLTLQPLVENAVKHNTITKSRPLTVSIYADREWITVSNPVQPKVDDTERGTGIGLKNIDSRYRLLTNRSIEIENDGETFVVKLPLSSDIG